MVVIGAGHNGLVAAGLLARQGLSVLVLEARDVVGGAAVSEHPFGPDYTVGPAARAGQAEKVTAPVVEAAEDTEPRA